MKHASIVRIILLLVLTGFLCTGLFSLLATQIPYEWVKSQLDALSVDGDAERFTQSVYASVITKLYILGIIAIVFSSLAFINKKNIEYYLTQHLAKFTKDLRECWFDTIAHVQSFYRHTDRLHFIALFTILVGGIAFRLFFLFQPIRHDEAFTFTNYASKPLILGLSNYSFPNNHLFHTLCVHMAYFLFGNQLWAIRLPAFLAGVFLIPATYFLVRALYEKHTALLTTAFLSVSSALIEYGTNARGYAFIMLFFILLLLLANYLRKKNNIAAWTSLAILSAMGLHTVPVMLYPFATVLLWIVWSSWQSDFSLPFKATIYQIFQYSTLTILLTGLLYLPVILASGLDAIIQNRFVQPMPLSAFINRLPERLLDVWSQWTLDYNFGLITLLAIATLIGIIAHHHRAQHRICLAFPAVLTLAILLPIQGVLPPERVWLYLLPLFYTVASTGFYTFLQRALPHQTVAKTVVYISLCLGLWGGINATQTLNTYYPYGPGTLKDAEVITQYLKPQLQSSDRLLTIATAAPLEYYFNKHNVNINHLRQDIANSNRLIVLVLEKKYTLEQVLQVANIPTQDFTAPNLLCAYPSARLYEMNRILTTYLPNNHHMENTHDNRN